MEDGRFVEDGSWRTVRGGRSWRTDSRGFVVGGRGGRTPGFCVARADGRLLHGGVRLRGEQRFRASFVRGNIFQPKHIIGTTISREITESDDPKQDVLFWLKNIFEIENFVFSVNRDAGIIHNIRSHFVFDPH